MEVNSDTKKAKADSQSEAALGVEDVEGDQIFSQSRYIGFIKIRHWETSCRVLARTVREKREIS